jgi:hypothetical protein
VGVIIKLFELEYEGVYTADLQHIYLKLWNINHVNDVMMCNLQTIKILPTVKYMLHVNVHIHVCIGKKLSGTSNVHRSITFKIPVNGDGESVNIREPEIDSGNLRLTTRLPEW